MTIFSAYKKTPISTKEFQQSCFSDAINQTSSKVFSGHPNRTPFPPTSNHGFLNWVFYSSHYLHVFSPLQHRILPLQIPNSYGLLQAFKSDRKALLDPLNHLASWHGLAYCAWRGIRCDNRTRLIIHIDLHRLGLSRSIREFASSLPRLTGLRHLDLSSNSFDADPIPQSICSLHNLRCIWTFRILGLAGDSRLSWKTCPGCASLTSLL
ncbi:hypothetical protein QJS10_CPB22g01060 [Acorus calamus]|uniref:Leucine-rich repeat-containing N-terminal plant-type domain-containing protein n=1 Tax=Acorus calamus TaxID=4465 RepID=A0AAV9C071_ACOCL|nr:hypothetical protein QJS10_CPB22g01060 [Acorus calamus]